MSPVPRRLGVAVVTALLVAAAATAAPPATADSQSYRDARGDVAGRARTAPGPAGIDVVRSYNGYEDSTLTVSLTAVRLLDRGFVAGWTIRTPDTYYRLTYDHRGRQPEVRFAEGRRHAAGRHGGRVPGCRRLSADTQRDLVAVELPRHCLGGAGRVRVAGYLVQPTTSGASRIDDSRQDGFASGRLTFGPVLRGQ